MPINLSFNRPRLEQSATVPLIFNIGSVTTSVSKALVPVLIEINPLNITIANCVITEASTTITGNFQNFDVRPGDIISSATALPLNTTVVSSSATQIVISAGAEESVAVATLTIEPPTFFAKVADVELNLKVSGGSLKIEPTTFVYGGSSQSVNNVPTPATAVNKDSAVVGGIGSIDLDQFLAQSRLPRI